MIGSTMLTEVGRTRRRDFHEAAETHRRRTSAVADRRSPLRRLVDRGDARGVRDIAPALVGLAPFGFLLGVQISHSGINELAGLAGGLLIFGGSAQLSAVTLMSQGAAVVAVVGTAVLINLRLLLFGAALEPRFRRQPAWFRWLAPQLLVDPTYAVAVARTDLTEPKQFRRYWLTVGAVLTGAWLGSMTLGALLGSTVPSPAPLRFAPVAVFIGLLVPHLRARPEIAAAITGGLVVTVLPGSPGVVVLAAVVAGMAVGLAAERRS